MYIASKRSIVHAKDH